MYTVYCYHCIPTGKKYIGKTIREQRRKAQHKHYAESGNMDTHFYRAVRKYGWESFIYGVIRYCADVDEMDRLEIESISEYRTLTEGYNMTVGGEGTSGYKHPPHVIKKMCESKRGRVLTQEHKDKIRKKSKGRKLTQESIQKIKENRKGRTPFAGRTHREDTINKMSSTYRIEYTNGETEIVTNLKAYCKERGYNEGLVHRVQKGKQTRHKNIVSVEKHH